MPAPADYTDPSLPSEERSARLLAQMTLEEKIGQMCQYVGEAAMPVGGASAVAGADNADEVVGYALSLGEKRELIRAGRVGSFLKVPGAREANYLQELAAGSRLGIPLLIGTDAIHGHGMDVPAATIFPSPIGIAASFEPELAERIAACTAAEMRVTGFHWSFSPTLDVVRDPRWGRTGETFGEDPFLVAELGAAMVRGYQGADLSRPTCVLACAKHLVAGGIPDNGLNGAPAELSERTLHETFYPPFERAVQAGAYTVMPSHNEVNGVPCHADARMLGELLRGHWGFRGFIVSDWLDIERLHSVHRVAETRRDADRLAVLAGVDMHMHGGEFFDNVHELALAGDIPMARIDAAVLPILRAKFQLGLFENRYSRPEEIEATLLCQAHRDVALEASRKSLVLLQNREGVLPLGAIRRLVVTGSGAADQSLLGDWARRQPEGNVVSVLKGITTLAPPHLSVEHVPTGAIAFISDEDIEAAARSAREADVVVLVMGESSLRDDPERTSGENVDRASLDLPGRQLELLDAVADTGTPVVAVLVNGAPIASERLVERAAAILEAWEPGMLGGRAIAEVLFGGYNPSGKLPISVPRSVGHLRSYYNHRPSAHHRGKFRFTATEPLFALGHGLSYSRFEYRALRARESIEIGEGLAVEVEVVNVGPRAGEEVVLLFVQDIYASVTRPVRELKAFTRVHLNPGETKLVGLSLPPEAFSMLDANLMRTTEPGEFRLTVGNGELQRSVWVK